MADAYEAFLRYDDDPKLQSDLCKLYGEGFREVL